MKQPSTLGEIYNPGRQLGRSRCHVAGTKFLQAMPKPAATSRQADAVVMTIGNGSSDLAGRVAPPPSRLNTSLGATGGCLENEGTDRKSTAVPQLQLPVLRAVLNATAAGRKPVVVVVFSVGRWICSS